jgi:voltage-dependent calcium channel N type alpha-1B
MEFITNFCLCRGSFFTFDNEDMLPKQEKRVWDNQNFHYDNVATAMLTLFAVQTGEGWPQ